jgi:phosphatidylglycerol---prolipoprotein diacylglyceryl transferase
VHPNLFSLLDHDVSGYMLLIAIGFIFATAMGALWVKRVGQNPDTVVDLGLASVVAGLVGARLLHVLADGYFWDYVHLCTDPSRVSWPVLRSECLGRLDGVWDEAALVCHPKRADCWSWAQIWGGGLTFYGGFIAATLAAWWLFRRDRFPFWKGVDMGGMMVPIGLGLGRLGCVMVGCCFGKSCALPWALQFPSHSPASEWQFRQKLLDSPFEVSLPVHPTQLYEAFAALAISAFTILFVQGRKRYDGQVFAVFLVLYAASRFVIEFWRSDDRGGLWALSTSQWIGVVMLGAGLAIHFGRGLRRKRAPLEPVAPQAARS